MAEMEEDVQVLMRADPSKQESLQSEIVPDPMDGEQTWPTAEELSEAAGEVWVAGRDYLSCSFSLLCCGQLCPIWGMASVCLALTQLFPRASQWQVEAIHVLCKTLVFFWIWHLFLQMPTVLHPFGNAASNTVGSGLCSPSLQLKRRLVIDGGVFCV